MEPQTPSSIGWQDYLAIVLRRRWLFAIPCAVIVVGAMIVGLFLPKIYRAETVLLVQDQKVINPLIQGLAVSTPIGEQMRTLREELLGWTSLSRLVRELGMDRHAKSPLSFERLIKGLQRNVLVQLRGRDLVLISYEDRNPELSQRLVNTLTNIYMNRSVESQSSEAETAISFLENEMAVYKKKLEDAERALREFKELYVMQMPVATQLNEQIIESEVSLAQLLVENTDAHPRVVETKRRIDELKQMRNAEIKRVITEAIVQGHDPGLYVDLAKTLDAPLTKEQEANPTIRAAKDAYTAWVNRLESSIATTPPTTAPQLQVVTGPDGNVANASLGVVGAATSISLAPRQEQELARLTRDYDVLSKTYQHMQERRERAKITQRLGESDEGTKFKVLEPARLPLKPVRPNMGKIFLFSLLLGIAIGAGFAFVAEYLDQSFQSAEEVQEALGLPVLGSISTIVTEQDLAHTRQRRKEWVSFGKNRQRLATTLAWCRRSILLPARALVDRALVRWGL